MSERLDWKFERINRARLEDLRREAQQERLANEAVAGRERQQGVFLRVMIWLGQGLAAWGQRRQQRRAAERPTQSFPVPDRSQ